jgi:hypothetical protein
MREIKLVLGHGNPHSLPTFYSFADYFTLSSSFLLLYFFIHIIFSPSLFLLLIFQGKKTLLWTFSGM